ncbi:RNA polymerase III subunit C53 isoform X1 [Arctopsyche grandis]|uniref:RNA polymerase III subunit C53 isoform X1 n=1 Tax=Arctopsyche grandis TaxID=121162 RepID=UPI00406D7DB5
MSNSDSKMTSVGDIPDGVVIKTEPGVVNTGRLSSFKQPRDLMLNNLTSNKQQPKKVFTPNLNAVRNKNKHLLIVDTSKQRRKNEKNDKHDRPKGNQNKGPGVLKSSGVFSEGIAAAPKRYHLRENYSGGNSKDGPSTLAKPVYKAKSEKKIEKEFEGLDIKGFMSDSDDASGDEFMDTQYLPIRLPMSCEGLYLPKKDNSAIKSVPSIKQEPVDKTESVDSVLMIDPLPEIFKHKIKTEPEESKAVIDYFQNPKMSLFMLQFPDSLPGRGPDTVPEGKDKTEKVDEKSEALNVCNFSHLEEGQIGKIVIYKSGKVKLLIGNTYYDLALGTQSQFRQDVMSISTNSEDRTGTMINLGDVQTKLTAIPDWEKMFNIDDDHS